MTIQTSGTCDLVNEATGAITGAAATANPAVVTGQHNGVYAGSTGAVVRWQTAGYVSGRRVQGKTFLVPLVQAFDTQGSIATTALTTLTNAANGLVTAGSGDFVVWHRPTAFASGSSHPVTGALVPDLAAVLRSRRT